MKIRWKWLVPTIVLFASPWLHWVLYHNFQLAWPQTDAGVLHGLAGFGALMAFLATTFMMSFP